jgi:hypothetical protein
MSTATPDRPERTYRKPLGADDAQRLHALYDEIPQVTCVHHRWTSEEGIALLAAVRALQVDGVPLLWMAQELGLTQTVLDSAANHARRVVARRAAERRNGRHRKGPDE